MRGTWYEGYKVSEREPSDEAVATMDHYLSKRDGTHLDFTVINCASGTDYEGAVALWFALPARRGEARGFAWEQRSMDTLRNLYLWRVDK